MLKDIFRHFPTLADNHRQRRDLAVNRKLERLKSPVERICMQAVGTGEANGLLLISRSEKQVHFSSSLDLQYSRGNAFITRTYPPNDQLQLRVDPIHGDLDEEVHGLHGKVVQLKQLAQHIESETKFQNELLNQLEATVAKAQAGLKSTMRRLNRNLAQRGLSPVVIVVLFALFCFFCVFLWSKFQRRR